MSPTNMTDSQITNEALKHTGNLKENRTASVTSHELELLNTRDHLLRSTSSSRASCLCIRWTPAVRNFAFISTQMAAIVGILIPVCTPDVDIPNEIYIPISAALVLSTVIFLSKPVPSENINYDNIDETT